MSLAALDRAKQVLGDTVTASHSYRGDETLVVNPLLILEAMQKLKEDPELQMNFLVDLTAVDYPKREERFDVVYILYSFVKNERIRVIARVAEGARPATVTTVHLTANWLEREVFDMFGIQFEGHPDMRRILLPEEWEGHPLRKEYGLIQQDDRWVKENLNIESGQ